MRTIEVPDVGEFDELWQLHPEDYSEILIHGKRVKVPRWDRIRKDYPFSNQVASHYADFLIGHELKFTSSKWLIRELA